MFSNLTPLDLILYVKQKTFIPGWCLLLSLVFSGGEDNLLCALWILGVPKESCLFFSRVGDEEDRFRSFCVLGVLVFLILPCFGGDKDLSRFFGVLGDLASCLFSSRFGGEVDLFRSLFFFGVLSWSWSFLGVTGLRSFLSVDGDLLLSLASFGLCVSLSSALLVGVLFVGSSFGVLSFVKRIKSHEVRVNWKVVSIDHN